MTPTSDYPGLATLVRGAGEPPWAFVLGSGLGPVVRRVRPVASVRFADIPGMVAPTVSGHGGQLIFGHWADRPVLVFTGRLHFYEGHPWPRVVRPIELLAELGAAGVVLTNAAGGINRDFAPGSLMLLRDHLEWNHPRHWRTPGPGHRPSPYSIAVRERLVAAARTAGIVLHEGVYAAVTGPTYETPAEVRALAASGADAVGMSTAREATRAAELGLGVAAISCIANLAAGLSPTPLSHAEVLEAVAGSADRLGAALERFVRDS
jgi:purine-nucleoside phosphorylase